MSDGETKLASRAQGPAPSTTVLAAALAYAFPQRNAEPGNPLAGGNGTKNLHRALEGSLRRLRTDYVDLYWMHVWDRVTPAEEVLDAMVALVRGGNPVFRSLGCAGLVRYPDGDAGRRAQPSL